VNFEGVERERDRGKVMADGDDMWGYYKHTRRRRRRRTRRSREYFWVCGGFQVKKTACNQRNGILYVGFFSNDRSVCLSFLFFSFLFFFNMYQGAVYFFNMFFKMSFKLFFI
jgi:hypothetical protein